VGFEPAPRCRHCGYEFSLMAEPLALAPLVDAAVRADDGGDDDGGLPLTLAATEPLLAPADLPLTPVETHTPTLFADVPPPAHTPLAVRKVTGERQRSRPSATPRPRPVLVERLPDPGVETPLASAANTPAVAPLLRRGASLAIDLLVIGLIDAAIVYLTAQIAGLSMVDVPSLPLMPLATFVGGLNLAYFVVFTACGGQTLGQMAMGVRVEGHDGRLTVGAATLRVIAAAAGGVVLGAGWWPAAVRADGQAVHDRLTRTRVVRVGAR
jgi:uncharacterized RDD family membrane protein YckC